MDTNETPQIIVTDQGKLYLLETAKWAKFLAIINFIFCGLIVIFAVACFSLSSTLSADIPIPLPGMFFTAYGIVLLIAACISAIPSYFLYRFGARAQKAIVSDDTVTMTEAFEWHKKYYKFTGIVTIVGLCIFALCIIIGVIAGIAAASLY